MPTSPASENEQRPASGSIERLMLRYQVKDLVNTDPLEFRASLDRFLQLRDHAGEGYSSPAQQRDISVQFYWGHNHDFGAFKLEGMNGDNHIRLLRAFTEQLRVLPESLAGKSVLDIGCWTGGSSLLLAAMGARVVAIEEVRKYADCVACLQRAFDIRELEPKNLSLFECTTPEFQDAFDYALFCGVLYHVTDPILALRIVFNSLKDGGTCLLETAVSESPGLDLAYKGPSVVWGGSEQQMNRRGWNWFFPSRQTLAQMMTDVGFADVRVTDGGGDRAFAVATRHRHRDMLRAGLSVRSIR